MDLQGTEHALKLLESEAQRARGLGDLRHDLRQMQSDLSDTISALDSSVANLQVTLALRTETLVRAAEALQTIVSEAELDRKKDLQAVVDATKRLELAQQERLRVIDSQLRAGLDAIFAQTKSIVREVDQSVQAQLTRTLTEFQAVVRNEMRATNDRLDLVQRELVQSQANALTAMTIRFWAALAIEITVISGLVVAVVWLLKFR